MCYRKQGGGAPAPPAHHHHGGGGGGSHASASCDPVDGYNVAPGKCSGRWIEVWGDGHFAHYGEDHHISSLDECAGFYTKNGKCSHWRSGSISARPQAGHTCYRKQGGGGGGSHASASCDPVDGYNVAPGKCSGRWIEVW